MFSISFISFMVGLEAEDYWFRRGQEVKVGQALNYEVA
jgi:hypothetical protein